MLLHHVMVLLIANVMGKLWLKSNTHLIKETKQLQEGVHWCLFIVEKKNGILTLSRTHRYYENLHYVGLCN